MCEAFNRSDREEQYIRPLYSTAPTFWYMRRHLTKEVGSSTEYLDDRKVWLSVSITSSIVGPRIEYCTVLKTEDKELVASESVCWDTEPFKTWKLDKISHVFDASSSDTSDSLCSCWSHTNISSTGAQLIVYQKVCYRAAHWNIQNWRAKMSKQGHNR